VSAERRLRVSYQDLFDTLLAALARTGMEPDRAALCAKLVADATRDGVASHGVNRFPRFMTMIRSGVVDVRARPALVAAHGALERWDGRRGPGNLNAHDSMARAIVLAAEHGVGCVALANTNHWMRGGTYGWQAADAGVIGICWTNTCPNMVPWRSSDARIGNNPLVIAVPRPSGHVVLDMAVSQFSVGAVTMHRLRGEPLPIDGGLDEAGRPTRDPAAIEATKKLLPIGLWKGSGLAVMLDLVGAILAGGLATHQIDSDPERETSLSQVFIACRVDAREAATIADAVIAYLHESTGAVRYPGERTLEARTKNVAEGIPIDERVWDEVRKLR